MDIQWGDIATWAASLVAVAFGALGFARSGQANKTAADALVAAKRQAASAEKANLTADEALAVARRATLAAEESVAETRRTADMAEIANARAGERNDVVWNVDSGRDTGRWTATNTGADVAYKAGVILKGRGIDIRTSPVDVAHGESVEIDLALHWEEARADLQSRRERARAAGILSGGSLTLGLSYRIVWETLTGAEAVWTPESRKPNYLKPGK